MPVIGKVDRNARGAVPGFLLDLVIDFQVNFLHQSGDFYVFEFAHVEARWIGGIEIDA